MKILGMKEYPERLERFTKALAGDKSGYTDVTSQMQEDEQYINSNNGKYNHFATTQKNLMTLGSWGEKRTYLQMQQGELGKNILRGILNVGSFIRNHTIAPIYGAIGKHIVAPIHSKVAKQNEGSMYRNRPLHRYEERKKYFENQGNNFLMSRINAVIKYKQANEEIVQKRIEQIEAAEASVTSHEAQKQGYKNEIDRLRKENKSLREGKTAEKYKNWEKVNGKIEDNQDKINEYQKRLTSILEQKDTYGGEAISEEAHQNASKKKITRATTIANIVLWSGAKGCINNLRKLKVQPEKQCEVQPKIRSRELITKHDLDRPLTMEERMRQLTLGDCIDLSGVEEVPVQYAVDYGNIKNFTADNIKYIRGLAFDKPGDGILSMTDGIGFNPEGYANYLTETLKSDDNLWDKLAELLSKSGEKVAPDELCRKFANSSLKKQLDFLKRINLTVDLKEYGVPLGHLPLTENKNLTGEIIEKGIKHAGSLISEDYTIRFIVR